MLRLAHGVAAFTYDKLPQAERRAPPDEGRVVAALEWAESLMSHQSIFRSQEGLAAGQVFKAFASHL